MVGNTVDVIIGSHAYQPPGRFKNIVQHRPFPDALRDVKPPDDLVIDPYNGSKDYTAVVTEECYKPCGEHKILALASGDFSPTTLSYLEQGRPTVNCKPSPYDLVRMSYGISKMNFGGHASFLMQGGYDHLIFPFETPEVKDIQVSMAKEAFKAHFGEYPKGAWAPEAGIDLQTLETFANNGIEFTVLAPWQAHGIKKIESENWEYVGGAIDPGKTYKCSLPNGKSIAIFFFDESLARKIAHNYCGIYSSSDSFLGHIKNTRQSGLTVTYNDLETWGHHWGLHKGVDSIKTVSEALLALYDGKEIDGTIYKLTTFSKYLKEHPPEYEVSIKGWTSWSCHRNGSDHGLGRWGDHIRTDCDCGDVWDSKWRSNLRSAHEFLNREIEKKFFHKVGPDYFIDPKQALKEYVLVLRGKEGLKDFLKKHAKPGVKNFEKMYKLLEMQKFSMLINTSCGWFHSNLKRIEPIMNMVAANSALRILKEILPGDKGQDIEGRFIELLSQVHVDFTSADNIFREAIAANPNYYGNGKPKSFLVTAPAVAA